ncbi:MAG: right-handed parallel beta-helix repeat-containing protein [Ignavibacteriales bacterium]|nr:right-handed parallel beta-helix repeat-containing protein [Ignavibacteriales bacterium]
MCTITKNTIKNYLYIFFLIIFLQLFQNYLYAQTKTVYTPEGYPYTAYIYSEFTQSQIATLNSEAYTLYIEPYQLNAVRIENASNRYRCHSYAWYISEGSLDTVDSAPDQYWDDEELSSDGLPSYLPQGRWNSYSETEATHSLDEFHSTRKIQNSYPRAIEGGRDYVSKWGSYGLYQHAKNHEPYYRGSGLDEYGNPVSHIFKKLKTTHYGTLATYPKTWVGAGGITHTVTQNLTVNTTLTIMPGVTVNFQNGVTMAVNGTLNVNSSLTIPSGVTLIVNSGAVLNFASGVSLTINGTLNAVGTSSNPITFNRIGSSGTWGGIQFNNGSSGNLQYCNINNATVGVYFYNSSSPQIRYCTFEYNGTAISCDYYSSPQIISNSNFRYNTYDGLRCNSYSSPGLLNYGYPGYNVIRNNSRYGVYASYNSNPGLGGYNYGQNSIYSNSSCEVLAEYNCNILAQSCWWGTYPPVQYDFCATQSTIIYLPALNYDPNPGRMIIANDEKNISTPISYSVQEDDLSSALDKQRDKKYDEAIPLFLEVFKSNKDALVGKYALIKIEECFTQAGKKDFLEYSKKELKPIIKTAGETFVVLLELETHQQVNAGLYKEAMDNIFLIKDKYNLNEEIDKNTLYRIGVFYSQLFGDKKNAQKYFDELKAKYPKDDLVNEIDRWLNTTSGSSKTEAT